MKNPTASVIARLKNYCSASGLDFTLVSRLYMQEGLLKRIFRSEYSSQFYLKGGLLLFSISEFTSRPTQDIDLLGKNIPNDDKNLQRIISNIICIEVDDCLTYDPDTITLSVITEGAEYQGKRIKIVCKLGTIRTVLKLDIGFGDSIYPDHITIQYPELLTEAAFSVHAYSLESVIAEKFEAMIVLDSMNSRMKDFYDIYSLMTQHDIQNSVLTEAIRQTFLTRNTILPDFPAVFSNGFGTAQRNRNLWQAFLKRIHAEIIPFEVVMTTINEQLEPIYQQLLQEAQDDP